jgi:hypothetical protein
MFGTHLLKFASSALFGYGVARYYVSPVNYYLDKEFIFGNDRFYDLDNFWKYIATTDDTAFFSDKNVKKRIKKLLAIRKIEFELDLPVEFFVMKVNTNNTTNIKKFANEYFEDFNVGKNSSEYDTYKLIFDLLTPENKKKLSIKFVKSYNFIRQFGLYFFSIEDGFDLLELAINGGYINSVDETKHVAYYEKHLDQYKAYAGEKRTNDMLMRLK